MDSNSQDKRICSGNFDEGLDIDLVEYAGLTSFTPEQYDELQEQLENDFGLLQRCEEHHYLILMDDEGNEQTLETENLEERFFFLYTDNESEFKSSLRKQILKAIRAD
jgi:hypothetical protein